MKIDLNEIALKPVPEADIYISIDGDELAEIDAAAFKTEHIKPFCLNCKKDVSEVFRICGSTVISGHVPCDRCLEDTPVSVMVDIDRSFPVIDDAVFEDKDDPLSALSEGVLDVCGLLQEEVLMGLPIKVLCSAECKGLCPVCGKNRNIFECDCDRVVLDPRMQKFLDVFKEV